MDAASVLMANAVMGPRIKAVEDKVDSITSPFQAIGRVDTVADLANVQNPEVGWVYLVGLENDPNKAEYWYTSSYNWEYLGQQITVDQTPTQSSDNPVSSGGVYSALGGKANTSDLAAFFKQTAAADVYNEQTTYSEGDYYVLNGELYKIVSGTATKITIASELTNLIASLVTVTSSGDVYVGNTLIIKYLTQTEYDLLDPPDPHVQYNILETTPSQLSMNNPSASLNLSQQSGLNLQNLEPLIEPQGLKGNDPTDEEGEDK